MGTTRASSRRAIPLQLELVGLELRQLQHVLEEALQALRVAVDDVDEADGRRRVGERTRAQRLGRRAHRRDRRAKLVGRIGHEVAAERLEAAQLGHVHEDDEQPLVLD